MFLTEGSAVTWAGKCDFARYAFPDCTSTEGEREDELELDLSIGKKKVACGRALLPSSDALSDILVSTSPSRQAIVGWPPVKASRKRCIVTNLSEGSDSGANTTNRSSSKRTCSNEAAALGPSFYDLSATKLLDGTSEFSLTYQDKDGDWMLVSDVLTTDEEEQ